MENYVLDWLGLLFRWLHLITGVAWIGASFYFMWLDNSLEEPPPWKRNKGIKGDLWAIHGGGIYEVAKYRLAPEAMPATLHWFKWEAYSTWLTGMVLLTLIYYLGAESYLIDPRVAELSPALAVGLGLTFIVGSYVAYELLCASPLARHPLWIAAVLAMAAAFLAWWLSRVFSGRGAYIHFGAIIGTLMVGNVFRVIMPAQRSLVSAIARGEAPDPAPAVKAKLHSTHNTYLTLPLLFIMISSHYPMTYAHPRNWLVLLALVVITAVARHYFVLRHRQVNRPWIVAGCGLATLLLAIAIAPAHLRSAGTADTATPEDALADEGWHIVRTHCTGCHARAPTDESFTRAPAGVMLDTPADVRQWSDRIRSQAIDTHNMPFMNSTGMTATERERLAQWLAAGAPAPG
ncbi:urate hydroxylase PuuD [Chromatocurvus halotolerans]|uniref:Putative membrane protein n=1 Tax=Chromatocurvus halotolerans TaxID=1132028 RepID=A0A4R2KZA3_9GAMM|nr:urate hydroxylase PuuD [Chromatocurvus halotolerans]TCO78247.1 putative membrane protein [Chromatocurvus halotolerans]